MATPPPPDKQSQVLHTAGLIVVKQNKLLLAFSKNKKAWYLPGGKIDPGETPLHALLREVEEELGVKLRASELQDYCHVTAPAFGEKAPILMEQDCFLGPAMDHYRAQNEIGAIRYFSYKAYKAQAPIVPGVITAFEQLMEDQLITKEVHL